MSSPTSLTRFIFHKDECQGGRVRHVLFLTKKEPRPISVFITDGLSEREIWECGRWSHNQRRDRDQIHLRARGDFEVAAVIEAQLAVELATEEHPRHANIVGWPAEKKDRIAKAQLLANRSNLVTVPTHDQDS